jgi:hypothetical protein
MSAIGSLPAQVGDNRLPGIVFRPKAIAAVLSRDGASS